MIKWKDSAQRNTSLFTKFLVNKNNDKNNRLPLRLRLCFKIYMFLRRSWQLICSPPTYQKTKFAQHTPIIILVIKHWWPHNTCFWEYVARRGSFQGKLSGFSVSFLQLGNLFRINGHFNTRENVTSVLVSYKNYRMSVWILISII